MFFPLTSQVSIFHECARYCRTSWRKWSRRSISLVDFFFVDFWIENDIDWYLHQKALSLQLLILQFLQKFEVISSIIILGLYTVTSIILITIGDFFLAFHDTEVSWDHFKHHRDKLISLFEGNGNQSFIILQLIHFWADIFRQVIHPKEIVLLDILQIQLTIFYWYCRFFRISI